MFSVVFAGAVIAAVLAIGEWGSFGVPGRGVGRLPNDGKLHVVFFDVGQGDAALIRTPSGDDILVDGGPDSSIVQKLGTALPANDRDIELLILTHPHADHLVGLLEVLRRYQVRRILMTRVNHSTDVYDAFRAEMERQQSETDVPTTGRSIAFGETRLEFLWPREDWSGRAVSESGPGEGGGLNDTSIVFRLVYGETELLFMGDATSAVEDELLASASTTLDADVLKVGHHGSKYSTSRAFLDSVDPDIAAISVGKENTYGHPAYRVIKRLKDEGIQFFRTDENGDISIVSDGITLRTLLAGDPSP